MRTTLLLVICSLSLSLYAQSNKWLSKYDKDGVQVSVRGEKTNEYKAEVQVNASLKSCIALMQDIDSHTSFMGSIKEISILKQYSDQKFLIRTIIEMPFPMKNQELISEAVFKVIGNNETVKVELKSRPDALPMGKMKRMNLADGFWLFEKISELKTKITYQLKFDESNAPNWLVNYFVLENPIKTMSGFSKFVLKDKYKKATISWL
jgi:ribosome-associated toxin RatA of RatAB toxin-antitoxin module